MMCTARNLLIILILPLMLFASCAKNGNPSIPVSDSPGVLKSPDTSDAGLRMLWGFWKIRGDIRTGEIDIIPNREVAARLNALVFLEPPPLTYLKLAGPVKVNGNEIELTIALTHPFLGDTEFTAFDVKGILMTQANDARYPGPLVALANEEVTHLMNPDGYTLWWGAHLFPPNAEWPNQGYIDGMLGTPDEIVDFAPGINAYKYFCDDLGPDDDVSLIDPAHRGMFSAGATNKRKYKIKVIGGVFEVNYAVDANWAWPSPVPPVNVPEDFPPHANQPEAYRIDVTEVKNTLYHDGTFAGGDLILDITVYTWRDPSTTLAVFMEAPEVLTINFSDEPVETGDGWARYRVEALTCTPQETGSLRVLIGVQTSLMYLVSNFTDFPYEGSAWASYPLTAYFNHYTEVGSIPPTDGNPGDIRGIGQGELTPISSLPNYDRLYGIFAPAINGDHIVVPYTADYTYGSDFVGILESFGGGLSFTAIEFDMDVHGTEMSVVLDYSDTIHLLVQDGTFVNARLRYYTKALSEEPSEPLFDSAYDERFYHPYGSFPFIDDYDVLHILYSDWSGPDTIDYPCNIYEITTSNYIDFFDPVPIIENIAPGGDARSSSFLMSGDGEIFTVFGISNAEKDRDICFSRGFAGSMSIPIKLNIDTLKLNAFGNSLIFAGPGTKDCFVEWSNVPDDSKQIIPIAQIQGVYIPYNQPPSAIFDLAYNAKVDGGLCQSSTGTPFVLLVPYIDYFVYIYWDSEPPSHSKLGILGSDGGVKGNINPYSHHPYLVHTGYIIMPDGLVSFVRCNNDYVYNNSLFSPFDYF